MSGFVLTLDLLFKISRPQWVCGGWCNWITGSILSMTAVAGVNLLAYQISDGT